MGRQKMVRKDRLQQRIARRYSQEIVLIARKMMENQLDALSKVYVAGPCHENDI